MKQETKELIKFIKKALNQDLHHLAVSPGQEGLNEYNSHKLLKVKADAFLDSLENFEKQLKLGGYIPDVHGNPCKVGDKVRWLGSTNEYADNGHGRVHGEVYTLGYVNFSWEIQDSAGFVACVTDRSEIEKLFGQEDGVR